MKRTLGRVGLAVILLFCLTSSTFAADGYGENATGGAGGAIVTVTTAADFNTYVKSTLPYIIQVSGTIDLTPIGYRVFIASNKTIRGIDTSSKIIGQLGFANDANNVIIERLIITNPTVGEYHSDGISVKDRVTNVFITHCTFYDCGDGCIDITNQSDYVTVSWCKFYYVSLSGHVNLVGSSDTPADPDIGYLHVTFHHNWWSTKCMERMPSVRFGRAHVYNNYYNCSGNNYCVRTRLYAECLVENNYFKDVQNPWERYVTSAGGDPGKLRASHNALHNVTWNSTWTSGVVLIDGTDTVFTPPYSYTLDDANDVNTIVMAGAGISDGDATAPAAPTGLTVIAGEVNVPLDWNNNSEGDLAGYYVYRSTNSGPPYSRLNSTPLTNSDYVDNITTHDTTYYYVVTAVDTNSNESNYSSEVSGGLYGDFDRSGIVDMNDLPQFVDYWLETDDIANVDYYDDGIVNFREFALLANNWNNKADDLSKYLVAEYPFDDNSDSNIVINSLGVNGIFHGIHSFTSAHSVAGKVNSALNFNSPNNAYYMTNAGTLLEDFETIWDWTVFYGSKAIDTTIFKTGTGSLKLTSNPGATCYAVKTINLTVSQYGSGYWFYTPDATKIQTVQILFSSVANLTKFKRYNCTYPPYSYSWVTSEVKTGWNFVPINVSDWITGDDESFSNTMIRMRVLVAAASGQRAIVYFDSFYSGIVTKPKCIITFDDNRKEVIDTAYPMMAAYGFKGTCYIIAAKVGCNSTYMTLSNLTTLHNAGWDMSNHTYHHPVLPTLSEAAQETEINNGMLYLSTHGFTRNNEHLHLAYPGGNYNIDTRTACQNLGILTGRLASPNDLYNFKVNGLIDPFLITASGGYPIYEAAALISYIDTAIASGQSVVFYFHRIKNEETNDDWSPVKFASFLAYLDSKRDQIDVVTQSDWYSNLAELPRDYVDTNSTYQSNSLTLTCWLDPNDGQPSSIQKVFSRYVDDGNHFEVFLGTDGIFDANCVVAGVSKTVTLYQNGGSVSALANGSGSWVMLAAVLPDCNISGTGNLLIGSSFDGSLDDVRIYNKALTAEKIQRLYYQSDHF